MVFCYKRFLPHAHGDVYLVDEFVNCKFYSKLQITQHFLKNVLPLSKKKKKKAFRFYSFSVKTPEIACVYE